MCVSRSAIETARVLNNKAYFLVKKQRYDEAVGVLMTALREAKKTAETKIKESAAADSEHSSPSEDGPSQSIASPQAESSLPQNFQDSPDNCESNMLQDQLVEQGRQTPYIYKEPLYIPTSPDGYEDRSVTTLSFIIMFNIALSHHMKGAQSEDEVASRRAFEISKRLYELTFQMQAQDVESNLLLTSALLNNLTLVHKALDNIYEAEQCEQLLLSTLLLLVDMGGLASDNEKDLNGFMDNVMHLMGEQSTVASAA